MTSQRLREKWPSLLIFLLISFSVFIFGGLFRPDEWYLALNRAPWINRDRRLANISSRKFNIADDLGLTVGSQRNLVLAIFRTTLAADQLTQHNTHRCVGN
jgi:hypothetical protein